MFLCHARRRDQDAENEIGMDALERPHDTIYSSFWRLAGITGASGSSWN